MTAVRKITAADKPLLAIVLLNAGVKSRLAVQSGCIRAVVSGDFDRVALASVLNDNGFRFAAGLEFDRYSFDGQQAFVRGVMV